MRIVASNACVLLVRAMFVKKLSVKMSNVFYQEKFEDRHNGPRSTEAQEMLSFLGVQSLDELIEQTVPSQIRLKKINVFT